MRRRTATTRLRNAVRVGTIGVSHLVERIAFWLAVVFPAGYVGTYAIRGLVSVPDTVLIGAFLLNAVALFVGHSYARDRDTVRGEPA